MMNRRKHSLFDGSISITIEPRAGLADRLKIYTKINDAQE